MVHDDQFAVPFQKTGERNFFNMKMLMLFQFFCRSGTQKMEWVATDEILEEFSLHSS